jgi:hypothetical protein
MTEPNNISYRDTAARVVKNKSKYYRYVFNEYIAEYDHLMQSGLYQELTEKKLLIKHNEIEIDTNEPNVYKLLYPEQIPFQSYPYEWSSNQWKNAILAYIKINHISLKYGMILKDATPYNFYFHAGKAVMFDTSSFMFFKNNDNWIAYKQFCEEFLCPVALINFNGSEWSKLTIANLRGFKLKFVSKQLALKSWMNLTTLLHIHLHSKYSCNETIKDNKFKKGFTLEKIKSLQVILYNTISKWKLRSKNESHWVSYYEKDIESKEYLKDKEETIRKWLKNLNAHKIIDLGANTGKFSLIASEFANIVISLEEDGNCVNYIFKIIKEKNIENIFPLIGNLAEPSPSIGILNKETENINVRGESDIVLALAVTHHLFFTNKLSFNQIKDVLIKFCRNFLIVEFIKKEDEKIKILTKNKNYNFSKYNEIEFLKAFEKSFNLIEKKELNDSNRIIFMFKIKSLCKIDD